MHTGAEWRKAPIDWLNYWLSPNIILFVEHKLLGDGFQRGVTTEGDHRTTRKSDRRQD